MKEFDAYLFDADGTLLDTRELIYRSFLHMGREMGASLPERDFIESTVGLPIRRQMHVILGDGHPGEYYAQAIAVYGKYMLRAYPEFLAVFPGAETVLAELQNRGKKMAVVTSRRLANLQLFLRHLDLERYFSLLVTPESTRRHKPDPEPALFAMRELGVAPWRTVFIGDAVFDIQCGYGAGVETALVKWGGMDPAGWHPQPDYIVDAFCDLLPS